MSPSTVTTVDHDVMGRLLLQVEANAHRGGWDGPAAMYVLYDWHDDATAQVYRRVMEGRRGIPTRCGPYAAQSMVPPDALNGIASHGLYRLAMNLSLVGEGHYPVEVMIETMRQPAFLGVAFLCESWARTMADEEEREALGAVRFADIPGSVEMRQVCAVDTAGHDYFVSRPRGSKPTLYIPTAGVGDMTRYDGSIIESLRLIVAVIADLPRPPLPGIPSAWSRENQARPGDAS